MSLVDYVMIDGFLLKGIDMGSGGLEWMILIHGIYIRYFLRVAGRLLISMRDSISGKIIFIHLNIFP